MNRRLRFLSTGLLTGFCLVALPHSLQACAACYGASDSPMAQGMNWGIMTLLVVIACVLGGIVSFFVYLGRRSSAGSRSGPAGSAITKN